MRHLLRLAALWFVIVLATIAHAQPPASPPQPPPPAEPPPPTDTPPTPPIDPPPPPIVEPPAPPPLTEPSPPACNQESCVHFGVCPDPQSPGECITDVTTCRRSLRCRELGFCTPQNDQCVIFANQDCKQSRACMTHGLCAALGQTCVAEEPSHCQRSAICADVGACTPRGGICVQDETSDAPGNMKPRSVGMRTTGIAFTIAGPIMGLIGGALLATEDAGVVAGAFMAPIGGTILLMGVPMWALGAQEIPVNTEPESTGALATGVVIGSLGIGGMAMGGFFFALTEDNTLPAIPMLIGGSMFIGGLASAMYGIATVPATSNISFGVGPGTFDVTGRF